MIVDWDMSRLIVEKFKIVQFISTIDTIATTNL